MKSPALPHIKKFPAAKQQRLDDLLEKNSTGTLTPREKERLHALVDEAEALMVLNAKRPSIASGFIGILRRSR